MCNFMDVKSNYFKMGKEEFNFLIESFSQFVKHQIVQSFLIGKIETTNKIENIYSTRYDIFKIINDVSSSKDKKLFLLPMPTSIY